MRSASRNCRSVATPPPIRTSSPLSGGLGLPQRLRGRRIQEVERGVGQREAGSGMVGEDEHWGMEGRCASPPARPVEVLPRAALGTELVTAHDLGTDVAREVASEVVVQSSGSAGLGSVRPARGGKRPRGQVRREAGDATTSTLGMPEGRIEALAFAGAEPVHRHAEVLHSHQLRHPRPRSGRRLTRHDAVLVGFRRPQDTVRDRFSESSTPPSVNTNASLAPERGGQPQCSPAPRIWGEPRQGWVTEHRPTRRDGRTVSPTNGGRLRRRRHPRGGRRGPIRRRSARGSR